MNPSDELKNVVLHLYDSMAERDVGAMEELLSRQKGVLAIGTDPTEWWADYDVIIDAIKVQFQEAGSKPIVAGDLRAFVEGSVGWTIDRRTIRLANGKEMTVRETLVFHQEDGAWKIVQFHASLAVPNADIFG